MRARGFCKILILLIMSISFSAQAYLPEELPEAMQEVCAYEDDSVKKENCQHVLEAVENGDLSKGPVLYALKALKDLHFKMCDDRKLQNDCMVMVSDLDQVYKENGKEFIYRHPAYFINLCVGDTDRTHLKDVYYKTFTSRGTGSKKSREKANYTDLPGIKTTITGLFMTGLLQGFHPYFKSRSKYAKALGYKPKDERCKGDGSSKNEWLKECPVLRLQLSRLGGSLSGHSKPMHTTPFNSSSGCPSVGQDDNWIMRHMASQGNSLYIAYTRLEKYRNKFKLEGRCI